MRTTTLVVGFFLSVFSTAGFGVADPEGVSLQDRKPECKERHPEVPPEQCMIQDRPSPLQYARRFGDVVIVVSPPLEAQTGAAGSIPENVPRSSPPR